MSTIALCIPAYNAEKYLPDLLKSAKNQQIPFDEVFVYNDCSTDHTSQLAKNYGAIVIEGDKNRGCATGKNRLATVAKSDWLHFHDADDLLMPNFTKVAHNRIMKGNTPDITLMHFQYIDYVTRELLGEPKYIIEELENDPVKFNITNKVVNFALIKRLAFISIGGFNTDPAVLYNEDRAFYTKASIRGLSFGYEPELTCINYYYPGSMSAYNKSACAQAALQVWKLVKEQTGDRYKMEIAEQLLQNAAYAATASDWKTMRQSIRKSSEIYPKVVPSGSVYFKKLFKIMPAAAFFIREILIKNLTSLRAK